MLWPELLGTAWVSERLYPAVSVYQYVCVMRSLPEFSSQAQQFAGGSSGLLDWGCDAMCCM